MDACGAALRRRDRLPWRPAQRVAGVGDGRADADRLRDCRAAPGPTPSGSRGRASLVPPRHSVENQWDLLAPLGHRAARGSGQPAGRDAGRRSCGRGASTRSPGERRRRRATRRSIVHARERRQPVPPLAAGALSPTWRRRSRAKTRRRRIIISSGPSDRERRRRHGGGGAGSGPATPRQRDCPLRRIRLCRSLRALAGRAALYIGGDSGPLHIAATTTGADRRAVRTDAAGAVDAVARSRRQRHRGRRRPAAVPTVPSAALRARRLSLSDARSVRNACSTPARRIVVEGERRHGDDTDAHTPVRRHATAWSKSGSFRSSAWSRRHSSRSPSPQILLYGRGPVLVPAAPVAARAARCAGVLLAARRLRDADAAVGGLLARPGRQRAPTASSCLLFLLVPVVYDFARGPRARNLLTVIITVGAVSALVGIVQFAVLNYDSPRPPAARHAVALDDVFGHADARHLRGRRPPALRHARSGLGRRRDAGAHRQPRPHASTRSAWVGATAGVGIAAPAPRLPPDGDSADCSPPSFIATLADAVHRSDVFDLRPERSDEPRSRRDAAGWRRDRRGSSAHRRRTGHGRRVYPDYRVATAVQENNMHLHNVPMQIAAERGLAGAGHVALVRGLGARRPATAARSLASARCWRRPPSAAIVAMLTAGLFEYNFGDSEFLMLFLILVTLPFAARARRQACPERSHGLGITLPPLPSDSRARALDRRHARTPRARRRRRDARSVHRRPTCTASRRKRRCRSSLTTATSTAPAARPTSRSTRARSGAQVDLVGLVGAGRCGVARCGICCTAADVERGGSHHRRQAPDDHQGADRDDAQSAGRACRLRNR